MVLRLAKSEDLPFLKKMFSKVVENMHNNGIGLWNDFYPYCEFENDITKRQLYLIEETGVIKAAFVVFDTGSLSESLKWSDENAKAAYLARVGVNVDFLGQGLGGLIIDYAKTIAKQKGCEYLRLDVVDFNIPAIKLYEKHGFERVEGINVEYIEDSGTTLKEFGYELKCNFLEKTKGDSLKNFVKIDGFWWQYDPNTPEKETKIIDRFFNGDNIVDITDLETVHVDKEIELDWHGTVLHDDSFRTGWLSPDGVFYGCAPLYHAMQANSVHHKDEKILSQEGWLKIICSNSRKDKQSLQVDFSDVLYPTDQQLDYVKAHYQDCDLYSQLLQFSQTTETISND